VTPQARAASRRPTGRAVGSGAQTRPISRQGIPFVVSAPSGTGKTTVCRAVVARDAEIALSISHTTRTPRPREREGADYFFVSREAFEELVAQGAFLEHAEYRGNLYGTSWPALENPLARGHDVLLEIDTAGARQVRTRLPAARLIFLLPPSLAALERRLRARQTDSEEVIRQRLAIAKDEIAQAPWYDYAVVNDDLEHAISSVLEIVRAERNGETAALRARFEPRASLR
jgi:guanylate kinase